MGAAFEAAGRDKQRRSIGRDRSNGKGRDALDSNKRKCCLCSGTFKRHQNEIRIPI